ncbi:MAG TPA: DUF2243 domain-containing protein [Pyrinomonadaceae bacterium]|jgi:uncharacterized membrane protein|nr:DUF2243 domain-containing protein [Pyrinomonadaceae bacterium]
MVEVKHKGKASVAGILLGIGFGGFVDGIVLHQILQWHNMVSNWIPPTTMEAMSVNMVWDGIFHAAVWLVTLIGVFLLWSAAYRQAAIPSLKAFVGQLFLGWGLFNLVEGVIDHQILGVHYVRQVPNYTIYNLTFLAVGGVLFILLGWMLVRTGTRESEINVTSDSRNI